MFAQRYRTFFKTFIVFWESFFVFCFYHDNTLHIIYFSIHLLLLINRRFWSVYQIIFNNFLTSVIKIKPSPCAIFFFHSNAQTSKIIVNVTATNFTWLSKYGLNKINILSFSISCIPYLLYFTNIRFYNFSRFGIKLHNHHTTKTWIFFQQTTNRTIIFQMITISVTWFVVYRFHELYAFTDQYIANIITFTIV
jgi:hypothetical protein